MSEQKLPKGAAERGAVSGPLFLSEEWSALRSYLPLCKAFPSKQWRPYYRPDGAGFKTDKIDKELALLICNAQYTFQQHFFGAIAEIHYENVQTAEAANHRMQQKTMLAYYRLPNLFTSEDVKREYGYDNVGSVCYCLKSLCDDGLAQKVRHGENKGKYQKLTD